MAGLLLARASRRAPEIAVRTALGAGRPQIIRQLLVESVFLSVCGGALGVGFARGILAVLLRLVPRDLPRIHDISADATVLAFVTAVSVITGLAFGKATAALAVIRRHYAVVIGVGGAVLIAMGVLIWTGEFTQLNITVNHWLQAVGLPNLNSNT